MSLTRQQPEPQPGLRVQTLDRPFHSCMTWLWAAESIAAELVDREGLAVVNLAKTPGKVGSTKTFQMEGMV